MFSREIKRRLDLLNSIGTTLDTQVDSSAQVIATAVKSNNFLFFAGNGGSAAEAQHMSAEYIATLDHRNFRPGMKAIALTVDTSFLTAWTNDFGLEHVFARQIEALGSKGDIFFAYSTSGNSHNIIEATRQAKRQNMITLGFSGNNGGELASLCDICFVVPSNSTALIQEVHTMLGHTICGKVEKLVFPNE